jgi:CBS domain-containing protein
MDSSLQPFSSDMPAAEALRRLSEIGCRTWPVCRGGELQGMIREDSLRAAPGAGITAGDLVAPDEVLPFVHSDEPLDIALERMGGSSVDVLPVVSRVDLRAVLGIIRLPDALKAYGLRL